MPAKLILEGGFASLHEMVWGVGVMAPLAIPSFANVFAKSFPMMPMWA